MTFQFDASHHQHELEAEAEHEQLVREARSSGRRPSAVSRARAAVGLGIVELGIALGGEGRPPAREGRGAAAVARGLGPPADAPLGCGHVSDAHHRPTPFTGDDEADRFLVQEPLALLIGFALDQQVTVQKAFSGPLELRRRLGHLDAARIAGTDPAELERVFRTPPAIHRFPGSMAGKVQALTKVIAEDYGNDAGRVWTEAADGRDLQRRLLALPGIGEMKARALIAIVGRRLGVKPPGWDEVAPTGPTLGDVETPEDLARYQEGKRGPRARRRPRARAAKAPRQQGPTSDPDARLCRPTVAGPVPPGSAAKDVVPAADGLSPAAERPSDRPVVRRAVPGPVPGGPRPRTA